MLFGLTSKDGKQLCFIYASEELYLFVDSTIPVGPFELDALSKALADVGLVPEDLTLDYPDQSCKRSNSNVRNRLE